MADEAVPVRLRPGVPFFWGYSSAGRAPVLHAGGQRFDPAILHHIDYKELSADTKWFQTAFCSPCFVILWDYSSAG